MGMDKCGPAYSAAAHLPALPHPLGYFWPGKPVPTRFSALLNALQHKTNMNQALFCSVADPGSGTFLTPESGMGKNQDPDPGRTFRIISESLENIFWVKST
jgi:hypothetical protein